MRYWAYIDRWGNWHGQRPVTHAQYCTVHTILKGRRQEFLSLNRYNANGTQTGMRLVFDVDNHNTEKARYDAAQVIARVGELTNAMPHVYFSGNKGYHIETDFSVSGERAHEICKGIATKLFPTLASLDFKIYRQRSLFRLADSPASKTGFFKVRLDAEEIDLPSDWHKESSIRRLHWTPKEIDQPDYSRLAELTLESTRALSPWAEPAPKVDGQQGHDLIVTPCITRIASIPPPEGQRNLTIFVLARHHKQFGKTQAETLDLLLSNPNFSHPRAAKAINATVKSLFHSKRDVKVGCKGSTNEASLMREHCDSWCPFSTVPLPTPTHGRSNATTLGNPPVLQGSTTLSTTLCEGQSMGSEKQPSRTDARAIPLQNP